MHQDFKTLWKNLAREKKNTRVHSIQYAILKAMSAKGEDKVAIATHMIRQAFTPISNVNKLANGNTPWQAMRYYAGTKIILGVPWEELLTEEEFEQFKSIASALTQAKMTRHYSYFFTRQDIFDEYQLVQTAHVALELGNRLTKEQCKDLHFTCCGVKDLQELKDVERVIQSMKLDYVAFHEPDIGNQMTAIGVYPVPENRKGLLRNYNLLRFRPNDLILPS